MKTEEAPVEQHLRLYYKKRAALEADRRLILDAVGPGPVTFIRGSGNTGDALIWAGTRELLRDTPYTEISIDELEGVSGGTALLAGSGGWCSTWPIMPHYLPLVEERFRKVVVLPSSYDVSVQPVYEALRGSNATFFARERVSFDQIRDLGRAYLAHDCAFFFDFIPYLMRGCGCGTLYAYRRDAEASGGTVPSENRDISAIYHDLNQWLRVIAEHRLVYTDRAHVMIAAAVLGKTVYYRPSNYHKVPAIAKYSLRDFPVYLK